jgi:hypothetical protein
MYGPGSHWWGPPPPYGQQQPNVVYIPVPTPSKGKGRGGKVKAPTDIFAILEKAQSDLDKAKKMFKEEDKKKDDKKDEGSPLTKKRFSLLETIAFNFIFGLPTSFVLFLLYKAVSKLGGL